MRKAKVLRRLRPRLRNRDGHAAIFERAGRILAFAFQENFAIAADHFAQARRKNERRISFA